MGCPVHIWLPAMAAMAPFARVARDRVRSMWVRSDTEAQRRTRVVRRFAPIGAGGVAAPSESERDG